MSDLPRRIAFITGDPALPDPTKQDHRYGPEDLAIHAELRRALAAIGKFDFEVIERHEGLFERLREMGPELVVNFCDTGLFNVPQQEIHIPTQLELMRLPYTGAPPRAILLCYDKQVVRLLAEAIGVPVPAEQFVMAADVRDARVEAYPALIKPNTADGSVGITGRALVRDESEARDYLAWIAGELPGTDVLIQEFLPGTEYGLGMIGNPGDGFDALPMIELDYSGLPSGLAPIQSFEAKAVPDSPYWGAIGSRAAALSEAEQRALARRCEALFRRLSLRDYGRFDFRTAADGTIRLMEVNPNPAWGYDATLATMARLAGRDYPAMLEQLIAAAWRRVTRGAAAR
jgi:D-alanine-D-alanine ligase